MIVHNFDPILIDLGIFQIRWYSVAYILGIIIGWMYATKIIKLTTTNQYNFEQIKKSVMLFNAPIQRVYQANRGTIIRTIIYTIGHFIIAASCVMYFTGASFSAAITDAIVEPLLNSIWYFVLDKYWASRHPS